MFENDPTKIRLSRFIHPLEVARNDFVKLRFCSVLNEFIVFQGLTAYSYYKAAGAKILTSVDNGDYSKNDLYVAHAHLSLDRHSDVILITNQ